MKPILSILFILSTLSCSALELSAPSSLVEAIAPANQITLAWQSSPLVSGNLVLAGISSGQYIRQWDAGTNQTLTIITPPGGFTWYFAVESYNLYSPETNRVRHIEATSGIASEYALGVPCPWNGAQLLVTNGVWVVSCNGLGNLQSSVDLITWTNVGPAGYASVAIYSGAITNQQFFRVHQP